MLQVYTSVASRAPIGSYNPEQAMVRRAQEDPSAFADLYRQHVKQVYRYVLTKVSNVSDAHDLTSQTFLTELESLPNFRGQGAFAAWLMGIARHKVMDHYRQVLPHPEYDLEEADEVMDHELRPDEAVSRKLQLERVTAKLEVIAPSQARTIPGDKDRHRQATEPVLPLVHAEPAEQKTRVLLVDDSIESHTLMRFYFRNTPYDLEIASDGEQAVATFQTGRFDFVLIDLHLPGMDGFTATRAMRAWETAHKRPLTTIVARTASSVADTQAQSLAVGCTDFLTKPITKAHLFSTLRKYRRSSPVTDTTPAQAAGTPDVTERIDDELRRRRPAFLANRRTDLTLMQDALLQGDYEAIQTTGHRMKGLAGSFGFPDIGAVGQRLEQAARSRDREAIRRELDGLATMLDGVDQAA